MQGGAEKVISFISNNLNPRYFNLFLLVIGKEETAVFPFPIGKTKFLNENSVARSIPKIAKEITHRKPEIVFSTLIHLNLWLSSILFFYPKIKFITREASILSELKGINKFSFLQSFFYSILFPIYRFRVNKIVCQSDDMLDDFRVNFNVPLEKLVKISNPIQVKITMKRQEISKLDNDRAILKLVTVGRLSYVKGYDRIFSLLRKLKDTTNFKYTIIGNGPMKEYLLNLAVEYSIFDNVVFIDHLKEPMIEVIKNDFFLQGSYSEGFPNAVLEAASIGMPIIAFSSKGGTSEIIKNGINGYIINSEEEISILLNNWQNLRFENMENSVKDIWNKYSPDSIISKYEKLFFTIKS